MVVQVRRPVILRGVRDVDGALEFTGDLVVPNPAEMFPEDHPLVRQYPDEFAEPGDVAREKDAAQHVTSVPVEQATAAPGEKRNVRRQK